MAKVNRKKSHKIARVDVDFMQDLKGLARMRYMKNLAKKEPSMAEMTRLLRRTNAYEQVKAELKLKPKREDL